ncbi:ATP-binding protein [Anaerobacillus sp. MEB173]|uniref:ATP-binding protein n=1 Tax=Anaerobacillus sp. MEB173 TaxID=3383345 RepID=UPI003F92FEC5
MFDTLHSKLLVFFLLITFIPLLFVGYISYQSQKEVLTENFEQTLSIYSDNLAVEIEELIQERIADLKVLLGNPIISNSNSAPGAIKDELQYFLDVHGIYNDAIFIEPDGTITISMIDEVIGKNLSERNWFNAASAGEVFLSDIYFSPVLKVPVLVMGGPVKDENGNIIGIVSPAFDLRMLWKTIDRFSSQRKSVGLNGHAFLVNGKGDIIAHPNKSYVLSENFFYNNNFDIGTIREYANDNTVLFNEEKELLFSIAPISQVPGFDHEWFVIISVPESELYSPLKSLLAQYVILFSIVLLIVLIAVIKLSKFIVEPIEQLVDVTSAFASGKKVSPLRFKKYEEIETLNTTYNHMIKKLEEREKTHKRASLIIETTINGIISFDKKNEVITTFNPVCEKLFGLNKEHVLGKALTDICSASIDFNRFIEAVAQLEWCTEGNQTATKSFFECKMAGRSHSFLMNITTLPTLDDVESDEVLLIFSDITEKKYMEQELIRNEKLKSAGQLAAGFAHEIRNPLTTIRGFIQMFNHSDNQYLEKQYYPLVIEELDRVNSIVNDLLNLTRSSKDEKDNMETDINQVIKEVVTLYQSEAILKDITVDISFSELPLITINPKRLKQVLINLIQNAFEAMDSGGQLAITTNSHRDKIELVFEDTGPGMDQKTLENLGTPFFTTKESGTGLGLMTSYKIIEEEMNGRMLVDSELQVGTTFTIILPTNHK